MADKGEPRTVLVVDDEPGIVDLYSYRLEPEYDVRRAYGGREALEAVDESVDVVLLDRRMPDLTGDEVLVELRNRGLGCRVIMTTAVDPGLDIVGMPFDDYLCKPIDHEELTAAIEQQLSAAEYDQSLSEYFMALAKLEVLQRSHTQQVLAGDPEYQALQARAEELRELTDRSLSDLDVAVAFRQIDRGPSGSSSTSVEQNG